MQNNPDRDEDGNGAIAVLEVRNMTIETFNKASDIMQKINRLDEELYDLKDIMRKDTSKWMMEVRFSGSQPLKSINHYGLLPKFLEEAYKCSCEERRRLVEELEKL